jgi:hypothetical protein
VGVAVDDGHFWRGRAPPFVELHLQEGG